MTERPENSGEERRMRFASAAVSSDASTIPVCQVNPDSSSSVLKHGLQYKFKVHLHLSVFYTPHQFKQCQLRCYPGPLTPSEKATTSNEFRTFACKKRP
jgi:hypothetical protein